MPGIVYYHGGGWVIATVDTYDFSARALAAKTGSVVVSVEYRKGPEFRFPTAHNDAFAAYRWVRENAASLKIDAGRIAVAGESAGGNLAAAVCLMARDAGVPLPKHQLLVYPIARYDMNTPSYQQYANAMPLNKPLMQWFFANYLNSPADGQSPLISLVNAQNLQGLPPATVINAEIDPLQSEGQEYAAKLKAAGVPVTSKVYVGVTHEFFGMSSVVPQAQDAQILAAAELVKSLNL
jgi:acetyl esterase/lipase